MNLPCEIIRDLLPLYQDQVSSPESTAAVDAHLPDCPACSSALKEIQAELNATPDIPDDEISAQEAMGALGKRWRRSKLLTTMTWALLAIGLTLLCSWVINFLFMVDSIPATASQVEVVHLYRTPDSALNINFRYTDAKRAQDIEVNEYYLVDEQGNRACYLTLLRPRIILGTKRNAIAGGIGLRGFTDADADTRLYYGTPEDHFLIWEPSMEVPVLTVQEGVDLLANAAEE